MGFWKGLGLSLLLLPAAYLVVSVQGIGAAFGAIAICIWVFAFARAGRSAWQERQALKRVAKERSLSS